MTVINKICSDKHCNWQLWWYIHNTCYIQRLQKKIKGRILLQSIFAWNFIKSLKKRITLHIYM